MPFWSNQKLKQLKDEYIGERVWFRAEDSEIGSSINAGLVEPKIIVPCICDEKTGRITGRVESVTTATNRLDISAECRDCGNQIIARYPEEFVYKLHRNRSAQWSWWAEWR